jgi:hypothetical protein
MRPKRYSTISHLHFIDIILLVPDLESDKFDDKHITQCILDENLARRAEHYFSEMKRVVKGELIICFFCAVDIFSCTGVSKLQ